MVAYFPFCLVLCIVFLNPLRYHSFLSLVTISWNIKKVIFFYNSHSLILITHFRLNLFIIMPYDCFQKHNPNCMKFLLPKNSPRCLPFSTIEGFSVNGPDAVKPNLKQDFKNVLRNDNITRIRTHIIITLKGKILTRCWGSDVFF